MLLEFETEAAASEATHALTEIFESAGAVGEVVSTMSTIFRVMRTLFAKKRNGKVALHALRTRQFATFYMRKRYVLWKSEMKCARGP